MGADMPPSISRVAGTAVAVGVGVGTGVGAGHDAVHGSYVHDPPASGGGHAPRRRPAAEERANEVHVDDGSEVLGVLFQQWPEAHDAGVVDEDLRWAERVESGLDLCLVAHRCTQGDGTGHLGRRALRAGTVHVEGAHPIAGGCRGSGDLGADARGCSGDDQGALRRTHVDSGVRTTG